MKEYLSGSEWHILELGWNPLNQNRYETLFTLGNGYLGSRGALEETPTGAYPGTFFAGIFDNTGAQATEIVNAPNPIDLQVAVGGEKLSLTAMDVLDHKRIFDLRHALLYRETLYRTTVGRKRIRYRSIRFFSMHNPHIGVMRVELKPLHDDVVFTVKDSVDTSVTNRGWITEGDKRHFHIQDFDKVGAANYLCLKTLEKEILLAYGTQVQVSQGKRTRSEMRRSFTIKAKKNQTITITKYFSLFNSTTYSERVIQNKTIKTLKTAVDYGFDKLYHQHIKKWGRLWKRHDIRLVGDSDLERALRFNIYHMLIVGCENTPKDVSIGARSLSGDGYRGHVFWDTEIFLLPFFIFTFPDLAKKFLMYRFRRLDAARANAQNRGFAGAMFPWESAGTGDDVTPTWHKDFEGRVFEIHTQARQHHITADIPFALCQYYEMTDDHEFMLEAGLEILLETARFWASRFTFDSRKKKFVIKEVIGPDEFHENVDNNAFTNAMARWNLADALHYYRVLKKKNPKKVTNLSRRLKIKKAELETWRKFEKAVFIPQSKDGKLIEQFEGFFKKQKHPFPELDNHGLPRLPEKVPLEKIGNTQFLKQADVVMLMYLLPDFWDRKTMQFNFKHYEKRTLHKSSLSVPLHACMAARLGFRDLASRYLHLAAFSDLENLYGNTQDGIHAASLGGTWQAVVNGFCGIREIFGRLCFDPFLPHHWESVRFHLIFKGRLLDIKIDKTCVRIHAHRGPRKPATSKAPIPVQVYGKDHDLELGKSYRYQRKGKTAKVMELDGLF